MFDQRNQLWLIFLKSCLPDYRLHVLDGLIELISFDNFHERRRKFYLVNVSIVKGCFYVVWGRREWNWFFTFIFEVFFWLLSEMIIHIKLIWWPNFTWVVEASVVSSKAVFRRKTFLESKSRYSDKK